MMGFLRLNAGIHLGRDVFNETLKLVQKIVKFFSVNSQEWIQFSVNCTVLKNYSNSGLFFFGLKFKSKLYLFNYTIQDFAQKSKAPYLVSYTD